MTKTKRINFTTPIGTAMYPHITEKDEGHKFSSGKFDTRLIVPKDAGQALVDQIESYMPKISTPKKPYKIDDEGNYIFKAKSAYMPLIFDAKGKKIEKLPEGMRIRGGSRLRVAGVLNVYDGGVSLWMNQVQVVELAEEDGQFDAVDDGTFDSSEFQEPSFGDQPAATTSAMNL